MKAAIYARVSDIKLTEDGERRQDVNRQIDKLKKWADVMGWAAGGVDVYYDDGASAFKEDYQSRPAFVKLLREIRGHHYSRVVVEDLTRWSRRLEEGMKLLKEAAYFGCTVSSMHEGDVDVTSASGWMRSATALMFAEWASRVMSEKVKSGMARRGRDPSKACPACGVVHLGRHPGTCGCKACQRTKKRVGRIASSKIIKN